MSFFRLLLLSLTTSTLSCGYHWGLRERALPGGYSQIAVPMFQNKSREVGVEVDFTNAMIQKIEVSKVASIADASVAPVVLKGEVVNVTVTKGLGASPVVLPARAVLSAEYAIQVRTFLQLVRQSDQKVVWSGFFAGSRNYLAPRIGTPVVNSADALYNQSARQETIRLLADEIMNEAHDRMSEKF